MNDEELKDAAKDGTKEDVDSYYSDDTDIGDDELDLSFLDDDISEDDEDVDSQ
jgi:hypothetical protein